jgi:hypothetical protein
MIEEMFANHIHKGEWVKLILAWDGGQPMYVVHKGPARMELSSNSRRASWFTKRRATALTEFILQPVLGRREWLN